MSQARLRQGNLDFKVATYGRYVTDKETSVAVSVGDGTKDLNRYVVVYLAYRSYLSWFWKERKAVNVKV